MTSALSSKYPQGTPLAIQADHTTPLATIVRLVDIAGQAGYGQVLFAVSRTPAATP